MFQCCPSPSSLHMGPHCAAMPAIVFTSFANSIARVGGPQARHTRSSLECDKSDSERGALTICKLLLGTCAFALLVGCNTQIVTTDREAAINRAPPGARWVKDGMTRESRRADWVACGGGADMLDGFRRWIQPEKWETYWPQNERHIAALKTCMQAKNYSYRYPQRPGLADECDARCMHP